MKKIILAFSCIAAFSCASNQVNDQRRPSQVGYGAQATNKVECSIKQSKNGRAIDAAQGTVTEAGDLILTSDPRSDVAFKFELFRSKDLVLSATDNRTKFTASTSATYARDISLELGKDGQLDRFLSCSILEY